MLRTKDVFKVPEDHPEPAQANSFLDRHISRVSENTEYTSPFRNPQDTLKHSYAKSNKEKKFPTTSATANLNKLVPTEMGYTSMNKNDKRAKDIQFPPYLVENERRQAQLLVELQMKEAKLHELQKSSIILVRDVETGDLIPEAKVSSEESSSEDDDDDEEDEDEEEEDEDEEEEDEDEEEEDEDEEEEEEEEEDKKDVRSSNLDTGRLDEPEEPEAQETISVKIESIIDELDTKDGDILENPEGTEDEASERTDDDTTDNATPVQESKENYYGLEEPMDPSIAPMVRIEPMCVELLSAPVTNKGFSIKKLFTGDSDKSGASKHRSSNMTLGVQAPATQAFATPENPEYLVRTNEYGVVSKAMFDRINFEQDVHNKWLEEFNDNANEKYDSKMKEYEDILNQLQNDWETIEDKKKISTLKKQKKIEVLEYQLVKNILDVQSKYNLDKGKIIKETELMKLEKINAKENLLKKQTEVKQEIENLNNKKGSITNECNIWNSNLDNLTNLLDEKIKDIREINKKNLDIQKEIEELQISKLNLEKEIKENEELHKTNSEVLHQINVEKSYLPRLNSIDEDIATRFDKLALVKNEIISENNQLVILTKKLEDERLAHENEIKLKNEKMKKEQDAILKGKLSELQKKHDEEMADIHKKYEQKIRKHESEQTRAALDKFGTHDDDSTFEYVNEEEVIST